jgi:hypothetical protein
MKKQTPNCTEKDRACLIGETCPKNLCHSIRHGRKPPEKTPEADKMHLIKTAVKETGSAFLFAVRKWTSGNKLGLYKIPADPESMLRFEVSFGSW